MGWHSRRTICGSAGRRAREGGAGVRSTAVLKEVAAVLRYCNANGIRVVPRGAGTSLSGGALPLADAVALYFTVPLFVTALAGPLLGERSGWPVWAAVLLGFVGVMVMLQPGTGLFEPAALLSLLSAALYGSAMLMARRFGTSSC